MSTKADQEMFRSTARRLPLEQKANTPTNSQGKQLNLCEEGSPEVESAKRSMGLIDPDQVTPRGSACGGPPVS